MVSNQGYRAVRSQNGEFSATIRRELNIELDMYCKAIGMNKSTYVNKCVEKCLIEDKKNFVREQYSIYSKEQLIEMLLETRKEEADEWTKLQE